MCVEISWSCVVYALCVMGSCPVVMFWSHVMLASGAACIVGLMVRQVSPRLLIRCVCDICCVLSCPLSCMLILWRARSVFWICLMCLYCGCVMGDVCDCMPLSW